VTHTRKNLGQNGEKAAVNYLLEKGYALLATNFKTKTAEIDIIARDSETICFVEVKTRTSLKRGLPREAVNHTKQQKIISAATLYLKENNLFHQRARFDVVEVIYLKDLWQINLIKNAFQAQ